jgi:hypothetical protein
MVEPHTGLRFISSSSSLYSRPVRGERGLWTDGSNLSLLVVRGLRILEKAVYQFSIIKR